MTADQCQRQGYRFEVELARDLQVKKRKYAVKSTQDGTIDGIFFLKKMI
jgi:hypothetical protein